PLSDSDGLHLRYRIRRDDLQVDDDPTSVTYTDCTTTGFVRLSLCDQQGNRITSSFGYTVTMNRTNDYLEPTRGFDLNFSQDIAGLGGDVNYLRNEFTGSIYHGFAPG